MDHSHLLGSSSPSTSVLPPLPPGVQSLSRSASTSASTSTSTLPTRSLRRTSARPDLHAAATSRVQLVGRRRTSTPGTPVPAAGVQQPTARFPSVREQEAWLAAETGRRPLRRASVPDLRRRAAGAGAGEDRDRDSVAAAARVVRRVGRLREPRAESSAGAGVRAMAMVMDVDGEDSDEETVRAVEEAPQGASPSTVLSGVGMSVGASVEPPHITRARERILTRERNRLEMLRLMREQRQNTIEYTDVSRPPRSGAAATGAGGTGVRQEALVVQPQPVARSRTWFER
ncbi:hypothetical protein C8F04DRAFT_47593 [Mycena alexandri]|uniref:Uncharacterized protein n=1 Tax=Mycena alexandri TaxID=1745969 RepID=A0AAD6WZ88_9AGAR|nr:hypothetical protein C8F04DRAFT_47593 [Mycena alexandri]